MIKKERSNLLGSLVLVVLVVSLVFVMFELEDYTGKVTEDITPITKVDKEMVSKGYLVKLKGEPLIAKLKKEEKEEEEEIEITSEDEFKSGVVKGKKAVTRAKKGLEEKDIAEFEDYKSKLSSQKLDVKNKILTTLISKSETENEITGNVVGDEKSKKRRNVFLRDYNLVFNGFALDITKEEADEIKKIEGVENVYPNYRVYANLKDSVPLINADVAWTKNKNGLPCKGDNCLTGKGVTIGIIDTGVDYTHEDLGACTPEIFKTDNADYSKSALICKTSPCVADETLIGSSGGHGFIVDFFKQSDNPFDYWVEDIGVKPFKGEHNAPNTIDGCRDSPETSNRWGSYEKGIYLYDPSIESISIESKEDNKFIQGGKVKVKIKVFCASDRVSFGAETGATIVFYKNEKNRFRVIKTLRCKDAPPKPNFEDYYSGPSDFSEVEELAYKNFRPVWLEYIKSLYHVEEFSFDFKLDDVEGYHVIRAMVGDTWATSEDTFSRPLDDCIPSCPNPAIACLNFYEGWDYHVVEQDDVVIEVDRPTKIVKAPLVEEKCKVVSGFDFINKDNDPMDDHGHGTHVAAIAAGNGVLKGVAPDAKIYAYKVLSWEGYGQIDDILAGIERSMDPNQDGDLSDHVDVISLSLGGSCDWIGGYDSEYCGPDDILSQAIDHIVDVGVVAVVAAGNDGPRSGSIATPGTARKAITVGASDKTDVLADFSSRGPIKLTNKKIVKKPDLVAPGVNICAAQSSQDTIWKLIKDYRGRDSYCLDKNHIAISGTSMATPHVSGVAALLLQKDPSLTPLQVKNILKQNTFQILGNIDEVGAGRVDLTKIISECQDSDGIDLFIPGKVTLKGITYPDHCKDSSTVVEKRCIFDSDGDLLGVGAYKSKCKNGCSKGACVKEAKEKPKKNCIDNDANNIYFGGEVKFKGKVYKDFCLDNRKLMEYECKNDVVKESVANCPTVCISGARACRNPNQPNI